MARARNLKPSIFKNEILGVSDPLYTILFEGLWCHADREGRLEDRPMRIKVEILPYRENVNIDDMLSWLDQHGFIKRYVVDGEKYIQILNFTKHQNPHHMETPSEIPPMLGKANHFNHTPVSPKQRARIYERDGNKCVFCSSSESLQIDHVKLVAHGGTSDDDNLRTLCAQCNNKRSKRLAKRTDPALTLNPLTLTLNPITTLSGEAPDVTSHEQKKNGKAYKTDAIDILTFLNEKTGRQYRLTDTNLNFIIHRLKSGASVQDCKTVIAKKFREWGRDEKMSAYLRPATLFNATKFEQYLGECV